MKKIIKMFLLVAVLSFTGLSLTACGNCFAGGNNSGGGAKCGFTGNF